MSILVDKNTNQLVQGITGHEGNFHTKQMVEYGTKVVAGVTPGKGGDWVLDGKIPVFDSVKRIFGRLGFELREDASGRNYKELGIGEVSDLK